MLTDMSAPWQQAGWEQEFGVLDSQLLTFAGLQSDVLDRVDPRIVNSAYEHAAARLLGTMVTIPALRACRAVPYIEPAQQIEEAELKKRPARIPMQRPELAGGVQFNYDYLDELIGRCSMGVRVVVYHLGDLPVRPVPPFDTDQAQMMARSVESLVDLCRSDHVQLAPDLTQLQSDKLHRLIVDVEEYDI